MHTYGLHTYVRACVRTYRTKHPDQWSTFPSKNPPSLNLGIEAPINTAAVLEEYQHLSRDLAAWSFKIGHQTSLLSFLKSVHMGTIFDYFSRRIRYSFWETSLRADILAGRYQPRTLEPSIWLECCWLLRVYREHLEHFFSSAAAFPISIESHFLLVVEILIDGDLPMCVGWITFLVESPSLRG